MSNVADAKKTDTKEEKPTQAANPPAASTDKEAQKPPASPSKEPRKRVPWSEAQYYWRCIFFFTYLIVGIMICISFMVFHFGDKQFTLTGSYAGLNFLYNNLASKPIRDVQVVTGSCPLGYSQVTFGTWAGSQAGCDCSGTISAGSSCDAACTSQPAQNPADYKMWKDNTKIWCVLYDTDYTKDLTCGPGYDSNCYPGFCFKTGFCPVNFIEIAAAPSGKAGTGTTKGTYSLGSNNVYVYTSANSGASTTNFPPLIKLSVSMNDVPCSTQPANALGNYIYPLDKTPQSGCDAVDKDATSFTIDTDNQDNLFNVNGVPVFSNTAFATFAGIRKQITMYLTGQRIFDIAAQTNACTTIQQDAIQTAADAASNLNSSINGTTIAGISMHGVYFLLALLIFWGAWNQHRPLVDGFHSSSLFRKIFLFVIFGQTVIYIIMAALVWKNTDDIYLTQTYFGSINGCFTSSQPTNIINNFNSLVDLTVTKLLRYTNALFALGIFCQFMYWVPNYVDCCSWCRTRKQKNNA